MFAPAPPPVRRGSSRGASPPCGERRRRAGRSRRAPASPTTMTTVGPSSSRASSTATWAASSRCSTHQFLVRVRLTPSLAAWKCSSSTGVTSLPCTSPLGQQLEAPGEQPVVQLPVHLELGRHRVRQHDARMPGVGAGARRTPRPPGRVFHPPAAPGSRIRAGRRPGTVGAVAEHRDRAGLQHLEGRRGCRAPTSRRSRPRGRRLRRARRGPPRRPRSRRRRRCTPPRPPVANTPIPAAAASAVVPATVVAPLRRRPRPGRGRAGRA